MFQKIKINQFLKTEKKKLQFLRDLKKRDEFVWASFLNLKQLVKPNSNKV